MAIVMATSVRAQVSDATGTTVQKPSRGKVVIFASEKLGKEWIRSYFNTIPEQTASFNECEISLGTTLEKMGFEYPSPDFTPAQKAGARRLMTVFQRYNDMSMMANNTAVKAARIVDPSAGTVVLCSVNADSKMRWKRSSNVKSCADVYCKAVSMKNSKRLATHSIRRCLTAPEEIYVNIEAIREICAEAGRGIGDKMTND